MLDLIIRGGQVVTPWGVGGWDVAVGGGRIVGVAEQGTLPNEAGRVLDATDKVVVPGGIEPHAHIAMPLPGNPGKETAPPEEMSRAALFGGTTMLTDFAVQQRGIDIFQAIQERDGRWQGKSYCDYAYHCMLLGEVPSRVIAQMKEAIQAGFPTFKIFTTNIRPESTLGEHGRRLVSMGHLSALMEQAAQGGGLMFVHSEDDDIVQFMYRKLTEEDRTAWYHIHEVHNNTSEDVSFRRVLRAAEWTGASVYFVHVSAKEGVGALREARGRGLPIYGETLHNYVSFTADDYRRPDGPKYHTYPSLKSEEDRLALWDGLMKGEISTVATDGSCMDFSIKMAAQDHPRRQRRPPRRRDAAGNNLQRGCVEAGHVPPAVRGRHLGQRRPNHRLLPQEGRHRSRQRRRHRAHRPRDTEGPDVERSPPGRLQRLGGLGDQRVARDHHHGGQGGGARRPVLRGPGGRPAHPQKDRLRRPEPASMLENTIIRGLYT